MSLDRARGQRRDELSKDEGVINTIRSVGNEQEIFLNIPDGFVSIIDIAGCSELTVMVYLERRHQLEQRHNAIGFLDLQLTDRGASRLPFPVDDDLRARLVQRTKGVASRKWPHDKFPCS
jgi:hypothetical protein